MNRRTVVCVWALVSSCAFGDAIVGDRFEEEEDGFVRDKVDNILWEGTSSAGNLATVLAHCGAITRACSSYWRLPTNREWAEDVLDIGSYALDADDVNPPAPDSPAALMLGSGRYWATILQTRPDTTSRVSGHWIDVTSGIGESANESDVHMVRCVCSDES